MVQRPRSAGDDGTGASAWRIAGFAVAVALCAVGVWLIVTATSQRWTELGILAGLWGLLIAAFAAFGPRHSVTHETQVVPTTQLETIDAAAARRAYDSQLQQLLVREVAAAVAREVGGLRAEVAQLRTELIEKVGGQLRLERIETTRVIGSDIEALQREIDVLKHERQSALSAPARGLATVVEAQVADAGSGRRRRRDDDSNDLLAQILERETASGRHSL